MTKNSPWQQATASRQSGAASRRLAAKALDLVRRGSSLPDALAHAEEVELAPADRAFARRLAQGVLVQRNRLDARLKPALRRTPKPSWVYELLLVGLSQLEDDSVAEHAAVNATVEAAPAPVRSLINAILRKATRGELELPKIRGVQADALNAGLPEWLLLALRKDWGDALPEVVRGCNTPPPFVLRVNRQKCQPDVYREKLSAAGWDAEPIGSEGLVLNQAIELARLPGFAEGEVSVQNASAQLAATVLPLAPGMRVLDACAAPGGKTAHLLEREPTLEVTALDADPERLDDVASGLSRLGLAATLEASLLQEYDAAEAQFDRILLDVPCSATGVMRRHPEIRWLRRAGDIARLAAEQAELLRCAWSLLKPGGYLLYASCSILREETVDVVARFLEETADSKEHPLQLPPGEAMEAGWRIPPGGPWDGFYYALLVKSGPETVRESGA